MNIPNNIQLPSGSSSEQPDSRLFMDQRSRRIVFVSHCILNQNAMIDGLAEYPGVAEEVVKTILAAGCGMEQMECPELLHLGLDRKVDLTAVRTTGSEDSRVRMLMEKREGRSVCRRLAEKVSLRIMEYLKNGFTVEGVLGVNASPTCGVETTWVEGEEIPGHGVFIRALKESLARHKLAVPVQGINLNVPSATLRGFRDLSDTSTGKQNAI